MDEIYERYRTAEAALERRDLERARRQFEHLTLDAPGFAPAWDGLGQSLEGLGDLTGAGRCFRRAARLDPRNWRSRSLWGAALYRSGDLLGARRWLRRAAGLGPEVRVVHYHLGRCLADLGDLTGALRCFDRALTCAEGEITDTEVWIRIGDALRDREQYPEAEAAFERACLLAPEDRAVYHHWALLSRRREDWEDAERLARRARALEREGCRSLLLLVDLALDQQHWEAAQERISQLQGAAGQPRLAHAYRALLAFRRGDTDAARTQAFTALALAEPIYDGAADRALEVLRNLRGWRAQCRGYRLLVEVQCGEEVEYRPYLVLAPDEATARTFVQEFQAHLDPLPWKIIEVLVFRRHGEALVGVYQVAIPRVRFRVLE